MVMRRVLTATDVEPKDVVAEPSRRVGDQIEELVSLVGGPLAHAICPPAQAGPPALEGLVAHARVHFDERCARRGNDLAATARGRAAGGLVATTRCSAGSAHTARAAAADCRRTANICTSCRAAVRTRRGGSTGHGGGRCAAIASR